MKSRDQLPGFHSLTRHAEVVGSLKMDKPSAWSPADEGHRVFDPLLLWQRCPTIAQKGSEALVVDVNGPPKVR